MPYQIAYLTSDDPKDKRNSSGIYFYQSKALEKHCGNLLYLGPVRSHQIEIIRKSIILINRLLKKKFNPYHNKTISIIYSRIFKKKLDLLNCNFVFADKTSCEIAFLNTNVNIIYSTDATFKLLINYYPDYTNLSQYSSRKGNLIEQKAINHSSVVICASKWVADSVHNDYGFPEDKIHILPRGANLDIIPQKSLVVNKKKTDVIRLLFIGKEYERKGYEVAYKTMDYIRSKGQLVKIKTIGFTPPSHLIDQDVEVLPFIDKNTKEGMEMFAGAMLNADFFLLPTWAECMGIAFCEASAFGVISITRNSGGVTEVVKNGINGYALDYQSDYIAFGNKIIEIFNDEHKFHKMIQTSREYYEERLNWDVWGLEMKKVLDNIYQENLISRQKNNIN